MPPTSNDWRRPKNCRNWNWSRVNCAFVDTKSFSGAEARHHRVASRLVQLQSGRNFAADARRSCVALAAPNGLASQLAANGRCDCASSDVFARLSAAAELLERESELDVDVSSVPKKTRIAQGYNSAAFQQAQQVRQPMRLTLLCRVVQRYLDELSDLQIELDKISPNLKAVERYERVVERLVNQRVCLVVFTVVQESNDSVLEEARARAKAAADAFDAVRAQRTEKFNQAFQ